MSHCVLISSYYSGRLPLIIRYVTYTGFTVYSFTEIIPMLFFRDVYAMEPNAQDIESIGDVEYWQLQCKTYMEARSAMNKPESTWTAEERESVACLADMDEFTREKIAESLKDNNKGLHEAIGEQSKSKPESSQPSQVLGKRKNIYGDYGYKSTRTG